MARGELYIDLEAIAANWRALDRLSDPSVQTAAVVKANAYGLGLDAVGKRLMDEGARRFFVALAEEGTQLRRAIGPGPEINVLSGHMPGDAEAIAQAQLTPILNSITQITAHFETLPGHPFGIQLDTGMNRLGLELEEWAAVAEVALRAKPKLVMSHLACADDPSHPSNREQLKAFHHMTDGISVPRSLSATGGILLGPDYHFDLTRPGIGLYGGLPFEDAEPVCTVTLPVIQCRSVEAGETVGYGDTWEARAPSRIATISGGYADGFHRALSGKADLYAGPVPCRLAGRVSMDLMGVDVSHLEQDPTELTLIGPYQGVDQLADRAGTIGYEVLTSLGQRLERRYRGVR